MTSIGIATMETSESKKSINLNTVLCDRINVLPLFSAIIPTVPVNTRILY